MRRKIKAFTAILLCLMVILTAGCKPEEEPNNGETPTTTETEDSLHVTVIANPLVGGTVDGGGTFALNQSCTVTATPHHGYDFVNWTEEDKEVSIKASYTFEVVADRSLVAHFTPRSYQVMLSAEPSEGGSVSGGGEVTYGRTCTVTATPANGFLFNYWREGDEIVSMEASYTFTVYGNKTLVACFMSSQAPEGAINGLYSVSDTKKVWFSKGNLQYVGSSDCWRFATHQWDVVGQAQEFGTPESTWDLFGWGTSGYKHGAACYQPWSISIEYGDYYAYGNTYYNLYDGTGQADWGYNKIENGGNEENSGWRTLTADEWGYVLAERVTTSGVRFARGEVNGVNGVILLPDNWSESTYPLNCANLGEAPFHSNVISEIKWNLLEEAGAVFLPAAGCRGGEFVDFIGFHGHYWSASYDSDVSALNFFFIEGGLYPNYLDNRCFGYSVRLVR